MKIYHYHPDTNEYIGNSTATESPLEPGQYLIPAHATATAPPAKKAGKVAVYSEASDTWTQVADHRGDYYAPDGSEHKIEQLGEQPPAHWQKEKPAFLESWQIYDEDSGTVTEDLALCKADYRRQVETKLREELRKGASIDGRRYDCDEQSYQRMTSAHHVATAQDAYTAITWTLADNSSYQITTLAELQAIWLAMGQHIQRLFAIRNQHKGAIEALTTRADIQAYDYSAGW